MRTTAVIVLALTLVMFGLLFVANAPSNPLPANSKADRIVVLKSAHTMTLYSAGHELKTYKVALGRGTSGAKQRQGDHETPEGSYVIDGRNARSSFHLALHISYPNAADRNRAEWSGVSPGGDIMIHGVEPKLAWLGALQHESDWTDGCIALTNAEMDEVWKAVGMGTPIDIQP